MKPEISIIVPTYFEEKMLDNILSHYTQAILNKYNAELIVSDGGSTDKTLEIAKKYTSKIAVHTSPGRQTIAEGRNAGAAVAEGNILAFINGDTFPEDLEALLSEITNWDEGKIFSKSGALATRVYVAREELIFSDKIFYNCFNSYVDFLNIIGVGMCRGECQIVKTKYFRQVGGYNPKLAAGEDFDLFRRLAKVTKTTYTNKITVIESPRRFRSEGYSKVLWQWTKNALSVMLRNDAADKEWKVIR